MWLISSSFFIYLLQRAGVLSANFYLSVFPRPCLSFLYGNLLSSSGRSFGSCVLFLLFVHSFIFFWLVRSGQAPVRKGKGTGTGTGKGRGKKREGFIFVLLWDRTIHDAHDTTICFNVCMCTTGYGLMMAL